MAGSNFHPNIIGNCPPRDALPASGYIYKVVKRFPPQPEDFTSDVERKTKNHDRNNCNCWGCSVWTDNDAVETALELFQFWKKKYVVRATVIPSDGVLKNTKTNTQQAHYTFWKTHGIDISSRCRIHRHPDTA